tara:strand:- start:994 stop:1158 length:165 start_codon:yes stop_codon:yes gene_type:complete
MSAELHDYRIQWQHFPSDSILETYIDNADALMLAKHILKMSQDSTLLKMWMVNQ